MLLHCSDFIVEEDYKLARLYFEKVLELGNRMYFVKKAKNYLDKIERSILKHPVMK